MTRISPDAPPPESQSPSPVVRLFQAMKGIKPETKVLMRAFATGFVVGVAGANLWEAHHDMAGTALMAGDFVSGIVARKELARIPREDPQAWQRAKGLTLIASVAGSLAGLALTGLIVPTALPKPVIAAVGVAGEAMFATFGALAVLQHRRNRPDHQMPRSF